MRLEVSRKVLVERLRALKGAVQGESPLVHGGTPSREGIVPLHLKLRGQILSMAFSDVDLALEVRLPVNGKEEGQVAVPQTFLKTIERLSSPSVELVTEGGTLEVRSGGFSTQLPLQEADDPCFPEGNGPFVPALRLAGVLEAATKAADPKNQMPAYRNILLEFAEGSLRVLGMNGFRLARSELPVQDLPQGKQVVSLKAAEALAKALKKLGGHLVNSRRSVPKGIVHLRLIVREDGLALRSADLRAALRCKDEEFPDYERIIPKELSFEAALQAEALQGALKRVAKERVDLAFEGGVLEVAGEGGLERLPIRASGSLPAKATFNPRHLMAVLGPLKGEARFGLEPRGIIGMLQAPSYMGLVASLSGGKA